MAIEALAADLAAFLLLAGGFAAFAVARLRSPGDALAARTGRALLWLLLWQGAGVSLRLLGWA